MVILQPINAQQKKIYMALDDHTDYMCYNLEEKDSKHLFSSWITTLN